MQTRSSIIKSIPVIGPVPVIGLLAAVLMAFVIAPRAFAQDTVIKVSFARPSKDPIPVNVLTGQSCLIIFDKPIGRLAVSNQETAEAVLVAPDQMTINGKASSRARFTIWSKDDSQFIFLDVDVRANLAQIDSQVRALFPKEDIRLSQANGSVVISGNVEPKVAQQVETVIQAAGFKTVNLLVQPVLTMTQVQLQIRVAEVSRNKISELAASPVVQTSPGQGGYSNTGLGPYSVNKVEEGSIFGAVASSLNLFVMSNDAFLFLRALQTQGALRALAEPNLIAMNGQQASFLAGGEIPIPIIQGGSNSTAVSILFKEYGVRVNFKPTILDEQHIRLELEPEVSTLDYGNAIRFGGFLIPALRVRRAKTGIELQDGQSFGIAGLLDNTEQKALSKIPIIADIPILGNLFKSKSFQKNETELVFIVTAKITKPLNPDAMPQMKGVDGLKGSPPLGVEMPNATGSGSATGSSGGATSSAISGSDKATSGASETGA
ncbi:MAG: type II and III secretion system protein family protein, partial [Blastocatellia bacterium]